MPKGKYRGAHVGSVAVRESGYFDLKAIEGKRLAQGISHRYIRIIHPPMDITTEEGAHSSRQ